MYRNICFTINNWSLEDIDAIANSKYTYVVVGFEVGDSGTPHLQGYMELKSQSRLSTIKKMLPRAHIEPRRGTQKQAIVYCQKDGTYVTDGRPRKAGERSDLDKVRQIALEEGMRGVTQYANAQQIRVAEKYLTYNEEGRDWKPMVVWLWGPTGTGKSRMARSLCDSDDIYTKNSGTKWWDGYDRHEYVIIDDFRPSWWDLTYMLALLDRYEFMVEFKGGMRQFVPRTIIITSAFAPEDTYKGTGEAIDQLVRRIDVIEHLVSTVSEVGCGNTVTHPPDTKDIQSNMLLGGSPSPPAAFASCLGSLGIPLPRHGLGDGGTKNIEESQLDLMFSSLLASCDQRIHNSTLSEPGSEQQPQQLTDPLPLPLN